MGKEMFFFINQLLNYFTNKANEKSFFIYQLKNKFNKLIGSSPSSSYFLFMSENLGKIWKLSLNSISPFS